MKLTSEQKLIEDINGTLADKIRDFCVRKGIMYCAIFGSRARGDERAGSDLDLLIDSPKVGVFGLVRLIRELEEELGLKVQVVTREGLKYSSGVAVEYFRKQIKKDLKVIHERK